MTNHQNDQSQNYARNREKDDSRHERIRNINQSTHEQGAGKPSYLGDAEEHTSDQPHMFSSYLRFFHEDKHQQR